MIKLTSGGIAALAAVALLAALFFLVDRRATERARENIERQDNAAADNADDARGRFDACAGGVWDFRAGQCRGTSADRRD